jgi:hypothetical protein
VQVMPVAQPSTWQKEFERFDREQQELLEQGLEEAASVSR